MATTLVTIAVVLAVVFLALAALWLWGERGHLLLPSTRRFFAEGGRLHGYVYGRWTPKYIDILLNKLPASPGGSKWMSDRYHGKVLTHENARAIVTLNEPIRRRDLEQIIPYPTARALVLNGPPDVVAYECVCRHARATPCGPTQVCMVVGEPFTDFMLEHQPGASRRLTQEEALALLHDEHERGHVHTAWFKDAMIGRFYAICNCCTCCCGGLRTMKEQGVPMVASSGYVAEIDASACSACGTCVDACPFDALAVERDTVVRTWERCMGCGVCVDTCPSDGITLVLDPNKGVPLDVRMLARRPVATA